MSIKSLLLLSILAVTTFNVSAQNNNQATVSGTVYTPSKLPATFVAVYLQGTNYSTTNEKGFYSATVTAGKYTICTSSLEYEAQSVDITLTAQQQLTLDFDLKESVNLLDGAQVQGKSKLAEVRKQAFNITALDARTLYNTSGDINQLLNKSTGIRIRESGGVGSDYNFSLNGFSGKQVKMFLDGIPMDNFGSSWNLNTLPTSAIERVEVYKGVLPVSLGADALGGAINVVSRRNANYLDVSYSIGSFNTHKASINGAYTDAKTGWTVRLNSYYSYSDNNYKVFVPILNLTTNQKGPSQWVKRFHDQYEAGGVKLETGITGKSYADYLLAGIILSGDKKDIQTGVTMESVFGAKTANSQSFIPSLRYKKSNLFTDGLTLTAYGAYNNIASKYIDTTARRYNWLGEWVPSSTTGETSRTQFSLKNKEWLGSLGLSYELNEHQTLSLNYVFSNLKRDVSDKEDPDNLTYKIPQSLTKQVAGLGWTVSYKRWNATLLAKLYDMQGDSYMYVDQYTANERLEPQSASYLNVGYGAAFSYFLLPKLQAKLSYEHTYRLPDGLEMFGDGLFSVRNPNLKPENSDNFNAGLAYELSVAPHHTLFAEANLLYRDSKDYIQKELQDPSTRFINLGKVKTLGVEGGLKYSWKNMVNAGVGITYQKITDNMEYIVTEGFGAGKKTNLTYGDQLPNIPYLFGNADAGCKFQDVLLKRTELSIDYSLIYVHEYYLSWPSLGSKSSKSIIPQQLAHSIAVGYSLHDKRYNISLECNNFTNALVYDNYMLQKPGRAFYLKLRYFIGR